MFATLRVLFDGERARTEDRLKDTYAIELIEQRIREAESNLSSAKLTLASLIQRRRSERRLTDTLDKRIATLEDRAREALESKRDDLASEAAEAIAEMENERRIRGETIERLDTRIAQLQRSVEAAHRRIVDLKQGAITARAVRREQLMQKRLNKTFAGNSAADEAEALIRRVVDQDDPFEQSEILRDIDRGLSGQGADDKLADEGFGDPNKVTAKAVLDRLKDKK
ncbi:MAG: PspA/IM30 family protein [Silicimonas sp.]|nr:PspA/IM30 family protein [Silicimonas sp.]NNL36650.1 PspA/IM30 family protein [Silicimonas sp.]RZW12473.1 MAG: PspA/IM30 family protein [Paracoccaceae bacterium]